MCIKSLFKLFLKLELKTLFNLKFQINCFSYSQIIQISRYVGQKYQHRADCKRFTFPFGFQSNAFEI